MSMSLDGSSRVAEALVDALTIDGTTITAASLSNLSGNEFEEFVELSNEIELSNEMDSTEEELIEDVVVEPEFDIHEVEIETERNRSPQAQEVIPEVKMKSTIPPLRPLTIAPKPARVPFTIKSTGGQQLLLLPGGTSGQQLKLVSPQGQGISLANLSLGKPITICPAGRTQTSNMSVLQPKQVIMKKINPQKVVETQSKPVTTNLVLQSPPSKTITFARAQQLGLISPKYNSQIVTKQTVTTAKPQAKTFKLVPQGKKILPAPQSMTSNKGTQRIVLKQANANSSIISPTQILQVTGGQPVVAGQLHQINIPGKGVQYIKLVTSSSNSDSTITSATVTSVSGGHSHPTKVMEPKLSVISPGGNISTKLTNVVLSESIATAHIAPKPIKTNAMTCGNTVHLPAPGQLVMLPANYLTTAKVAIPPNVKPKPAVLEPTNTISEGNMEANGIRPRKPCNCTKSQCLKLYCDCFANGEFCNMCNCMNCFNNLENEEHRQRAIKSCLERNPSAFRPKIGKAKDTGDASIRKHTKGCNCKRSGCLKNYCECYEAKIACSNNCKCVSCRNVEDSIDEKEMQTIANVPLPTYTPMLTKIGASRNMLELRPKRHSNSKQASSYITSDVIDATCRCMLLMAANAQNNGLGEEEQRKAVLIEYGKCLKEIIDSSKGRYIKNDEN